MFYTVRFDDLYNDSNKKIIIGKSMGEVDSIVKCFTIRNKKPLFKYEAKTVDKIATEFFVQNGKGAGCTLIGNREGAVLFFTFLKNNIVNDFVDNIIPKESVSLSTAQDAYEAMNQIRMGYEKIQNSKFNSIINDFEAFLDQNNYFDEPMVLKKSTEILQNCLNQCNKNNISFYILPNVWEKLSYAEREFLEEYAKSYKAKIKQIKWNDSNENVEQVKVPAFGYGNSVKFIIKEIKEKGLNLNDVAIYQPESAYNGLIKGLFDINKINYVFENGDSAANKDFVGFINAVLDFLSNHFEIEYLYSIYKNPALGGYNDAKNNYHSYAKPNILKDLKADGKQIISIINKNTHIDKEIKDFIIDLVNLYNEKDNTHKIFIKVFEFTKHYTNNLSHKGCVDAISETESFFEILDLANFDSYGERVDIIKLVLASVSCKSDEPKEESYVLVDSLNSTFLPRKYNFVIGLSAKELTKNEIESPFASDEELEDILDTQKGYVKLAKKKNEEFFEALKNLFLTQSEGKIYYIASVYDSVEFKELSKSAYYLGVNCKEENVYSDVQDINCQNADIEDIYIFPRTDENIDKVNDIELTPTLVETIVKCPLRYVYGRIYDDIQTDSFNDKWLKGGETGNFAHLILQKYFEKADGTVYNDVLFQQCYDDAFAETKNLYPFSNNHIQDKEAEKIKKMVKDYLDRYYLKTDNYKVIACELKIDRDNSVTYPNVPQYKIHGIIDRVDAFVDDDGDLKLRIIDYKTYSSMDGRIWSQCVFYPLIVNDYINKNIKKIESLVGKAFNQKEEYDCEFVFELLLLGKFYTPEKNEIVALIDEALKKFTLLKKNPTWEGFESTYIPKIENKSEHKEGRCAFCTFANFCRLKMENGDIKIWQN